MANYNIFYRTNLNTAKPKIAGIIFVMLWVNRRCYIDIAYLNPFEWNSHEKKTSLTVARPPHCDKSINDQRWMLDDRMHHYCSVADETMEQQYFKTVYSYNTIIIKYQDQHLPTMHVEYWLPILKPTTNTLVDMRFRTQQLIYAILIFIKSTHMNACDRCEYTSTARYIGTTTRHHNDNHSIKLCSVINVI